MATKTRYLSGYGILIDAESAEEKPLSGYGMINMNPVSDTSPQRISSMHFQRHYEPTAVSA